MANIKTDRIELANGDVAQLIPIAPGTDENGAYLGGVSEAQVAGWNGKSNVSVSPTGTSTDEVQYITINGVEKKLAGSSGGTEDFDQLTNRPKYNGSAMTHATNIPEVKTAAWDANTAARHSHANKALLDGIVSTDLVPSTEGANIGDVLTVGLNGVVEWDTTAVIRDAITDEDIANPWDDDETYSIGDYCYLQGRGTSPVYRCVQACSGVNPMLDVTHAYWTTVVIMEEVTSKQSKLPDYSSIDNDTPLVVGTYQGAKILKWGHDTPTTSRGIIADYDYAGVWDEEASYTVGKFVLYAPNGLIYKCTAACTGIAPTNTAYWDNVPTADLLDYINTKVGGKEASANKVTSLSSASTDTQYPSAKCVYDLLGNVESLLEALL